MTSRTTSVQPAQPEPEGPSVPDLPRLNEGNWRRFSRRFLSHKGSVVALAIVIGLVVVAVLPAQFASHDPLAQDLSKTLQSPGGEHWLGTDLLGRDVFSRLIFGCRVAMLAAGQAVLVAIGLGTIPGLLAGYFGGWVDTVISRVNDTVMTFPPLLLAISIVGILGAGLTNAMFAIGVIFAPRFLRLTRGSVMAVKEETYVEASLTIGTSTFRIIRTRILPNILSPLIVETAIALGFSMLAEASLSFLGLGVKPPEASWGSMVEEGTRSLNQAPLIAVASGLAIVVAVLSFNVLGDGIRDSFGRESRKHA